MGGLYSGRTALQDDSSVATLTCSIFSPRRVDPVPHDAPKPPGYTRFVCVSDTHSRTDPIQMPYGDVLIHAGDFTELGLPSEVKKFNEWLGRSCMLSALGACEGVTSRAALSCHPCPALHLLGWGCPPCWGAFPALLACVLYLSPVPSGSFQHLILTVTRLLVFGLGDPPKGSGSAPMCMVHPCVQS